MFIIMYRIHNYDNLHYILVPDAYTYCYLSEKKLPNFDSSYFVMYLNSLSSNVFGDSSMLYIPDVYFFPIHQFIIQL